MEKMETSDDSSSSSDNEENELESRAEALERNLTDNKYLYDTHLELVGLYRKLGDLKSMRAAYDRFHSVFPLTPQIWLTWIRIEMELAATPAEKKHVLQLFGKAVEDYLSIDLWLEYIQFSMGVLESDETRVIIEKGLTVGGLHVSEGSLLWDVLREFEVTLLSFTEPNSDEWKKQLLKVQDVFRRQLSVPLLDMENTFAEWKNWLEQLPSDHGIDVKQTEWTYRNALKILERYQPFESRLRGEDREEEIHTCFKEYIKACNDPSTVLCLFERAVAKLSLNTELWSDYCYFSLKLGDISARVVKRALQNCPWSEELWICSIRILEEQKKDQKDITECLEQGLAAITPTPGLNLWLSYLEYINRNTESKEHLHKLFSQAIQQLGAENDPSHVLSRWEARLYAKEGNVEAARRIWLDILQIPNFRKSASAWLEFASLERQYGEPNQLRALFQRSLSVALDWPQCVADEWLMFERECGTLHDMIRTSKICKDSLNSQSVANGVHTEEPEKEKAEKRKATRNIHEDEYKPKRPKTDREKPQEKKKKFNASDFDTEKSVFISNMRSDINEDKLKEVFPNAIKIWVPTDRKGHSRCFAYIEFNGEEEAGKALARDREPLEERPLFISKCRTLDKTPQKSFKYSVGSEKNKLFVRGLPLTHSQKDVEDIFKPYGAVAVRIVTYKSGKSKGLAYIEFPDETSAEAAMKATNEMTVGDFIISVAISAPPPKKAPSEERIATAGGGGFRNARTRLQVPFVPRVVQAKAITTVTTGENFTPQKSNEDFRKMLLKDKSN